MYSEKVKKMKINFTKMHGAGNDYVYINCFEQPIKRPQKLSMLVSRRHFSIGSDGLILILPSEKADFRMRMFNADGSEGKMCGNATRCIAKYVYDHKMTDKHDITLETLSGIKKIHIDTDVSGKFLSATVNMGAPILESAKIPCLIDSKEVIDWPADICGQKYNITCVSMGNPHCVVFVPNVDELNLEILGPKFENNEIFPERTNTEFVEIVNDNTIKIRVWERGSGETLACGTGACASVVAGILNHKINTDTVTAKLIGGDLTIRWKGEDVFMSGPAVTAYEGIIEVEGEY